MEIRILLIDDVKRFRDGFKKSVEREWGSAHPKTTVQVHLWDGIRSDSAKIVEPEVGDFDAVVLDLVWKRDGVSQVTYGIELAEQIRSNCPGIPLFLLTSAPDPSTYGDLLRIGFEDHLLKTFPVRSLCLRIWDGIVRARRGGKNHTFFRQINLATRFKGWNGTAVCAAATEVLSRGRPIDRWDGFWTKMSPLLAGLGLVTAFREMGTLFATSDLLMLGGARHLRGHLEHVINVFFTGYVISQKSSVFRKYAIQQSRILAGTYAGRDFSDDELWDCFQIAWLAAATLHDTAYSIELLGEVQDRCARIASSFGSMISVDPGITKPWDVSAVTSKCVEDIGMMSDLLSKLYTSNKFTTDFFRANSVFGQGASRRVNHGVMSGLLFLDKVRGAWEAKGVSGLLKPMMIWAASAMALHSLKKPGASAGYSIELERDALSYLLMACDEIQVWNRERPDASMMSSPFRDANLSYFDVVDKNGKTHIDCRVECLPYPDLVRDTSFDNYYTKFQQSLEGDRQVLSRWLKANDITVTIRREIADCEDRQLTDVKF